jgi:UDP-N-acetylglucosamine 2-epimerase (non-hydrolysing)
MKVAPLIRAFEKRNNGIEQILVHTGQHYDVNMSGIFFRQLGIPSPNINLEVGSGSHAKQMAKIMISLESFLLKEKPDLVLVPGDVNSTIAAALVCAKLLIPVGHIEAGLRSFDRTMPEEINRLLTDQIADLLFTPSVDANENLIREGVATNKIHFVGNVMIDTLVRLLPDAASRWSELCTMLNIEKNNYILVTLHRPSNVDEPKMLSQIVSVLEKISKKNKIVFPVHPRTRARIESLGVKIIENERFQVIDPIGYLDFLCLQHQAKVVLTDSGGVQEETTFLGVPCLTIRENTERPVTITTGTNILGGQDMLRLQSELMNILAGNIKSGAIPPLWDGHTGDRIVRVILGR